MAHALVVDDSRAVRKLLAQSLQVLGYEVTEAENGIAALDTLQTLPSPVQLILTDWNMPEMNGLEFLKAVRLKPESGAVPVVMVTTETEMGHIAAALEAGASEYVMKPFTLEILTDKLRLAGAQI